MIENAEVNVSALPPEVQPAFAELVSLLRELAGDRLLSLTAFGGWLAGDPAYDGTPARSVVVLKDIDLGMLDRLARRGPGFGRRGLGAPLLMTPPYIAVSRDVFPLELLEIQQARVVIWGTDEFGGLTFAAADVRLQCERELKSTLIQLRQGLLAAAGRHKRLGEVCRAETTRVLRVLRGLLHLRDVPPPAMADELIAAAARHMGVSLDAFGQVVAQRAAVDFGLFERLYRELAALSERVDGLNIDGPLPV